jgi:hypothetical protein
MIHYYIKSQPDLKNPSGTIITVSPGLAGVTQPTGSAYSINKLGEHRFGEFVDAGMFSIRQYIVLDTDFYCTEYPNLRVFTTMPNTVGTDMPSNALLPYALDHVDLTGMLSLYLTQPRVDYLKACLVGVSWDMEELEAHKDEILSKKLLRTSWLPILPFGRGNGLDT